MDEERQATLLKRAFLLGAITDAGALVPMLLPEVAELLWGFDDPTGEVRFAMGYGASLMLGWTVVLVWAYQRPMERRAVAAMTVLVICGLVLTEIVAVRSGSLDLMRTIPTWVLQGVLFTMFASAYHYPALKGRIPLLA